MSNLILLQVSAARRWCLAELGLEADIKLVDVKGEEHRRGAYAALNPFKKIPTLQDGDYTLVRPVHVSSAARLLV